MAMKQTIKKLANHLLSRTVQYRLVHEQLAIDFAADSWLHLARIGFEASQIIDVGAGRGEWTRNMMSIYPNARYFMIEPLTENLPGLRAIADSHAGTSFWSGAAGNSEGQLRLYEHRDQTSMFSSEWGGAPRTVPMRSLDSLAAWQRITRVDILKLDVQGGEMETLQGARNLLRSCRAIQIEVSFRRVYQEAPLAHEIIAFLSGHGFRIFDICDLYKRRDRALIQADIIFLSEDAWFRPETYHA